MTIDHRPLLSAALREARETGSSWFTWPDGSRLRLSPLQGPFAPTGQVKWEVDGRWVIVVYHSHFLAGQYVDKDGGYLGACCWLEAEKLGDRAHETLRFAKDFRAVIEEAECGPWVERMGMGR